jgi:hypothetical protein
MSHDPNLNPGLKLHLETGTKHLRERLDPSLPIRAFGVVSILSLLPSTTFQPASAGLRIPRSAEDATRCSTLVLPLPGSLKTTFVISVIVRGFAVADVLREDTILWSAPRYDARAIVPAATCEASAILETGWQHGDVTSRGRGAQYLTQLGPTLKVISAPLDIMLLSHLYHHLYLHLCPQRWLMVNPSDM